MGDNIALETEGGEIGAGAPKGGIPKSERSLRIMFFQTLANKGAVGEQLRIGRTSALS